MKTPAQTIDIVSSSLGSGHEGGGAGEARSLDERRSSLTAGAIGGDDLRGEVIGGQAIQGEEFGGKGQRGKFSRGKVKVTTGKGTVGEVFGGGTKESIQRDNLPKSQNLPSLRPGAQGQVTSSGQVKVIHTDSRSSPVSGEITTSADNECGAYPDKQSVLARKRRTHQNRNVVAPFIKDSDRSSKEPNFLPKRARADSIIQKRPILIQDSSKSAELFSFTRDNHDGQLLVDDSESTSCSSTPEVGRRQETRASVYDTATTLSSLKSGPSVDDEVTPIRNELIPDDDIPGVSFIGRSARPSATSSQQDPAVSAEHFPSISSSPGTSTKTALVYPLQNGRVKRGVSFTDPSGLPNYHASVPCHSKCPPYQAAASGLCPKCQVKCVCPCHANTSVCPSRHSCCLQCCSLQQIHQDPKPTGPLIHDLLKNGRQIYPPGSVDSRCVTPVNPSSSSTHLLLDSTSPVWVTRSSRVAVASSTPQPHPPPCQHPDEEWAERVSENGASEHHSGNYRDSRESLKRGKSSGKSSQRSNACARRAMTHRGRRGCCRVLHLKEDNARFLLLAAVMVIYMLCGAAVFQALERDNEIAKKIVYLEYLNNFTATYPMVNRSDLQKLLTIHSQAETAGIVGDRRPRWDFSGAFYFVGTVVSTIGEFSPCCVYSLISYNINRQK